MKVLKFGGSSVAKPDRILQVAKILKGYYENGVDFSVVFSALGGTTDSLIKMTELASSGNNEYEELLKDFHKRHIDTAQELLKSEGLKEAIKKIDKNYKSLKKLLYGISLLKEVSPRTLDYVISYGERSSAFILSKVLQAHGINAQYLDARKILKTNATFGAAKVNFSVTNDTIKAYYKQNVGIQIVTGFIGSTEDDITTTLGRGGSDYTAAIIAAALDAKVIEIWTDVNGVLTADPRKVKKALSIAEMSYAEAMEMSHFGAKVIYPPTLQPALLKEIPLYIKNTFNPDFKGTLISASASLNGHPIRGISSISKIALLTIQGSGLFGVPGIAARLFNSLAVAKINVILITQGSSESSISFAVQPIEAEAAKNIVENEFKFEMREGSINPVKLELDLSVIAIIGENMRYQPGIASRLFQALGKNGINCIAIAQGSSELNVSVVIQNKDEHKALNALHEAFFLSKTKVLHIFMVGAGLIGKTLIKQIQKQSAFLLKNQAIELKLVGLANSRTMVFDEDGLKLDVFMDQLSVSTIKSSIPDFVEKMMTMNLPNTIFIDNTASEDVSNQYEKILDGSVSISTPNKIATSSSYPRYQRLQKIANKRGVQFHYETNVGAGLPVINTLRDLINSGDRILKIEGVLSGSLSYIFNSFSSGTKFSEIVKEAQERGYTEPDPRIDLMGIDIRRKIIILARETGLPLEADDVIIESILPDACINAQTIDEFFIELKNANQGFEKKRLAAEEENKVLRMVAVLENGKAKIGIQAVEGNHPFQSLSGSDNMIVFTTDRYKDRPLVIKGPGAGAEVTAAGVFAEIIKIGKHLS